MADKTFDQYKSEELFEMITTGRKGEVATLYSQHFADYQAGKENARNFVADTQNSWEPLKESMAEPAFPKDETVRSYVLNDDAPSKQKLESMGSFKDAPKKSPEAVKPEPEKAPVKEVKEQTAPAPVAPSSPSPEKEKPAVAKDDEPRFADGSTIPTMKEWNKQVAESEFFSGQGYTSPTTGQKLAPQPSLTPSTTASLATTSIAQTPAPVSSVPSAATISAAAPAQQQLPPYYFDKDMSLKDSLVGKQSDDLAKNGQGITPEQKDKLIEFLKTPSVQTQAPAQDLAKTEKPEPKPEPKAKAEPEPREMSFAEQLAAMNKSPEKMYVQGATKIIKAEDGPADSRQAALEKAREIGSGIRAELVDNGKGTSHDSSHAIPNANGQRQPGGRDLA